MAGFMTAVLIGSDGRMLQTRSIAYDAVIGVHEAIKSLNADRKPFGPRWFDAGSIVPLRARRGRRA